MFEAYSVGIRLKLIDGVAAGLAGLSSSFAIFNRHIATSQAGLTGIEMQMRRLRTMGLVGGAMAGVGVAGLSLFKGPIEEAAKFQQQVQKFKLYGLGDAVTAEATKFAQGMNIIGTSYTDAMRLMNEAQGVFREGGLSGSAALAGAKLAAPMLAKIDFAAAGLDDETRARMHTQGLAMLRFIEMRGGLQDAKKFNEIADAGWKAIWTSGGNVNWEQYRQFMARGGVAAQGLSSEALFGKLEPIIGELKGSTAGTALMTAYNRLIGGVRVPNQVAHMLTDAGIWDKNKIIWNSLGGIKRFTGNPLSKEDMELLSKDPTAFYDKDIAPMYAKSNLSYAERARNNLLFFGRTGGNFFTLYDRQRAVALRSVEAQKKALGVDASVDVAKKTLQGSTIDLHAKWRNLMNELGTTVLPLAVSALEKFTSAIKSLTDAANAHPTATKIGEYGALGLTGLSVLGGATILAKAGWGALRTLGMGRLALGAAGGVGAALLSPEALVLGGAAATGYGAYKAYQWIRGDDAKPVVNVTVVNKIDKNGLATMVTQEQAKGLKAPETGIAGFDGRQALRPAGATGSW